MANFNLVTGRNAGSILIFRVSYLLPGAGMPRNWRKFVAVLMIALFAQGSMLANAPLIWCLSGNDHSIVEFGIGGGWHGLPAAAKRGKWKPYNAGKQQDHPAECVDIDLVSPASVSAKQKIDMTPQVILPAFGWRDVSASLMETMQRVGMVGTPPPDLVSLQLVQLRTVFLLN